jgi:hypothetical protein
VDGQALVASHGAQHVPVGHRALPSPSIAQALLEQRQIRVYDRLPDGGSELNLAETAAAQAKASS